MKIRLAIGLGGLNATLAALGVASTYSPPAMAQGQNVESVQKIGICPRNWREGGQHPGQAGLRGRCYPYTSDAPKIYLTARNGETCAPGYYEWGRYCTTDKPVLVSAETRSSPTNRLTKPAPNARCPLGWASTRDLQACYTTFEQPTVARLSNGKPCRADELAEWGMWCTSNYQNIDPTRAENAGAKDFNEVYAWTLRNRGDPNSVGDSLSPAAATWFAGKAPAAAKPVDRATPTPQQASSQSAAPCGTDATVGAVLGGAIGGTSGATIGSALGKLGRKKAGC